MNYSNIDYLRLAEENKLFQTYWLTINELERLELHDEKISGSGFYFQLATFSREKENERRESK